MSKNPVFGYLFGKKKPARLVAGVGVKKWSDCGLKSVVFFVADIFLLCVILRNKTDRRIIRIRIESLISIIIFDFSEILNYFSDKTTVAFTIMVTLTACY